MYYFMLSNRINIVVCIVVLLFSSGTCTDTCPDITNCLFPYLIRIMYGRTYNDCYKSCLLRQACKVFGYSKQTSACRLFNTENEDLCDVSTECNRPLHSFRKVDTEERLSDILGACANHTCPIGTVCEATDANRICKIQECPINPLSAPDGSIIIKGNMVNVGSKLRLSCLGKRWLEGPTISECLPNGTWTGYDAKCILYCDQPDDVINADVMTSGQRVTTSSQSAATSVDIYLEGYTMQYECHGGMSLQGEEFVTCTYNAWGPLPVCSYSMFETCDVTTSVICSAASSQCLNGICQCQPFSYIYDSDNEACVVMCPTYISEYFIDDDGHVSGFRKYSNTVKPYLHSITAVVRRNVDSLDACLSSCVVDYDVTCKAVQYRIYQNQNRCYIVQFALSNGDLHVRDTSSTIYLRECAKV